MPKSKVDRIQAEIMALQKAHDRLKEDVNYSDQPGMKDQLAAMRERLRNMHAELQAASRAELEGEMSGWYTKKRGVN